MLPSDLDLLRMVSFCFFAKLLRASGVVLSEIVDSFWGATLCWKWPDLFFSLPFLLDLDLVGVEYISLEWSFLEF